MNEIESALFKYVEDGERRPEDRHGEGYIGQVFVNRGYPFNAIEDAFKALFEKKILVHKDGWVIPNWIKEKDDVVDAAHGGFPGQLLNHVSDENRNRYKDVAVPDYIKAVMEADLPVPVSPEKNPAVHSPDHYTRGGIECIDFIEAKGLNFHLGNTVKYVSRAGFKQDAKLQDLEKALWYLTREIDRIKKQEP